MVTATCGLETYGYERKINSICPICKKAIEGAIFEDRGKIYLRKECPEHGQFEDIIHVNARVYQWNQHFLKDGIKADRPTTAAVNGCPHDCGLCPNHVNTPAICLIDVTNRCNLKCPICFANANVTGYTIEPPLDEIAKIMEHFRNITPNPPMTLQLSGGEPTVREDLPDLIRRGSELGFKHIILTTNGLKLAESVEYCLELAEAGLNGIYLQFDGVQPQTYLNTRGRDLLETKFEAVENWRRVNEEWQSKHGKPRGGIVLVPTIAKGVNDHEIPGIIDFAVAHVGTVVGIAFQPIAMCGRIDREKVHEMRFTSSELQSRIDAHTKGVLNPWYPIPVISEFARLIDWFDDVPTVEFSCHPDCGFANWLIIDEKNNQLLGMKHYVDLDAALNYTCRMWKQIVEDGKEWNAGWLERKIKKARFLFEMQKFVLKRGHVFSILMHLILSPSYESAEAFMFGKNLMIGCMHFQDPYNMDLDRVKRCVVHYGYMNRDRSIRQVPFCTMNALHRERIEKEIAQRLGTYRDVRPEEKIPVPVATVD